MGKVILDFRKDGAEIYSVSAQPYKAKPEGLAALFDEDQMSTMMPSLVQMVVRALTSAAIQGAADSLGERSGYLVRDALPDRLLLKRSGEVHMAAHRDRDLD